MPASGAARQPSPMPQNVPQRRVPSRRPVPPSKHRPKVLRSKNMPGIYKRGNVFFVVTKGQSYRPSKNFVISVVVIFACALMVVLGNAQITGVETQTFQANRRLQGLMDENFALETQLTRHYTTDQIRYLAFMRLGMTDPDPSQIIEINVPRQNHVMFNTAEEILPQENSFWTDLGIFFSGVLDRLIGG